MAQQQHARDVDRERVGEQQTVVIGEAQSPLHGGERDGCASAAEQHPPFQRHEDARGDIAGGRCQEPSCVGVAYGAERIAYIDELQHQRQQPEADDEAQSELGCAAQPRPQYGRSPASRRLTLWA